MSHHNKVISEEIHVHASGCIFKISITFLEDEMTPGRTRVVASKPLASDNEREF